MPETTVFGATTPQAPNSNSQDPGLLDALVGEGKKYATIEALAKGYVEADSFLDTLKGENATLRKTVEGAKTIETVLERLNAQAAPTGDNQTVSAPDIAKIVKETVTGMETERTRQENLVKADKAMKALFGAKAQEVFDTQAKDPATKAALMALAEVSPDQFVALFDKTNVVAASSAAAGGGYNAAALLGKPVQRVDDPTTQAFYSNIRKTNPKLYYSTDFQLSMHKAAQANPEKFFG